MVSHPWPADASSSPHRSETPADGPSVPALSPAAAKALALLRDPGFRTPRIVAVLEQDPALAELVLRAASSPSYGVSVRLKSLSSAVQRLGLRRMRSALIEASLAPLYTSADPRLAPLLSRLWTRARAVAILTRALFSELDFTGDRELAYVCGLLHEAGVPFAARLLLADQDGARLDGADDRFCDALVAPAHRALSAALVEKWCLPADVIDAVRASSDYDAMRGRSLGNLTVLASALADRAGYTVRPIDPVYNKAMTMLAELVLRIDARTIEAAASRLADFERPGPSS